MLTQRPKPCSATWTRSAMVDCGRPGLHRKIASGVVSPEVPG